MTAARTVRGRMAGVGAGVRSTADMSMRTAAGVLTHNSYRPLMQNFNEKHYVLVGRVSGGIVLIGAVVVSAGFDTIFQMIKFIWEFNAILAAAFWCGIKWRRATRKAAWSSMAVTMLLFALLPISIPGFCPTLRTNDYLLKLTDPKPITPSNARRKSESDNRKERIVQGEQRNQQSLAKGHRTAAIDIGQKITKTIQPPRKSFVWSKGVRQEDGVITGRGLLYIEMVVVDRVFDLSELSYAQSETIRSLSRVFVPFSIMILISLLTRPDDRKMLDRFYMKMRTEANIDREIDKAELEKSYANPQRFKEKLLFPNSNFELFKWDKIDTIGFIISVSMIFVVLGMLYLILHIGA